MLWNSRDAKSEQHEQRAAAIFPPAVLIFGLPTQKNMLKYAVLILWEKRALLLIFTLFASLIYSATHVRRTPRQLTSKSQSVLSMFIRFNKLWSAQSLHASPKAVVHTATVCSMK